MMQDEEISKFQQGLRDWIKECPWVSAQIIIT